MTRLEGSARVAEALREAPPALDDMKRARMEKRLLASLHGSNTGSRAAVAASTRAPRWPLALAAGAGVAIAAAVLLMVLSGPESQSASLATFEVRGAGGQSTPDADGTMQAGGSLAVGAGQEATLRVAHAQVELRSGARLVLRSASIERVEVELASGEVEVAFHPRERGREHLSVMTPAARVEVVGTVFTVRIDAHGATHVAVSEGTVRVVPRGEGEAAILVHAGEHTQVAPSLEGRLAELDPPSEAVAPAAEETGEQASPTPESEELLVFQLAELEAMATSAQAPAPAPREAPAPSPAARLEAARGWAEAGDHQRARPILIELTRAGPLDVRVEAETVLADSYAASGQPDRAADAYRRAAALGEGRASGLNALWALARLEERTLHDRDAARRDYMRYLEAAPEGTLAQHARRAVCRLGGAESIDCDE